MFGCFMAISKKELDKRINNFKEALRHSGIKLTHQRLEIFREVAKVIDHPAAETIFQRIRKRLPTVSLDTVYRTLWLANDLGLITTLRSSRQRTRFDANLSRHYHFICSKCGLAMDFHSDELDELTLSETLKDIGLPETTHLEVKGMCLKCAKNKKPREETSYDREQKVSGNRQI